MKQNGQPVGVAADNQCMARYKRHIEPGSVQHIYSRFVNREFRMKGSRERGNYLERVGPCVERTDWLPLAYALMTSHVHWALLAGILPSHRLIHPLHTGFALWLNRTQGRMGPVFAERHKNVGCEPGAVATLIAYIHANPVRAGVIDDPADSGWTSHRAYIGDVSAPPWLDVEKGLALCEYDATPSGRLAFHEFVCSQCSMPKEPNLTTEALDEKRTNMRRLLGDPIELSSPVYCDRNFMRVEVAGGYSSNANRRWSGDVTEVLQQVAIFAAVPIGLLRSKSRLRPVVQARRLAILVWCRYLGRPQAEIAAELGISSAASSKLLRRLESCMALDALARSIADSCWISCPIGYLTAAD